MAVREYDYKEDKYNKQGKAFRHYYGKSTDTKPTESLLTGSTFYEIDTGKLYMFDEDGVAGSEWIDQDFESGE